MKNEDGAGAMGAQARNTWNPQKQREEGEGSPPEPLRGASLAHTLILDFWPPQLLENKFLLF